MKARGLREPDRFGRVRRIHLVGIGGTGMCGIAEVLLSLGFTVTGTDQSRSEVTKRLGSLGAKIDHEHTSPLVRDADVVVVSTAIGSDNPEIAAAHERAIPVIRRAEMLAELMRMKRGVAIGGSHGKTSTTSLVGDVLTEGSLDPTVVVGGRVLRLGSNARIGAGDVLVAEADESDGTFLQLQPTIAVITNIDREHVDYYPSLDATCAAFVQFANNVPFYGAALLCLDDPHVQTVIPRISRRILTYGLQPGADLVAHNVQPTAGGSSFDLIWQGRSLGTCELRIPGRHNVANAAAAALVGLELGVSPERIIRGLEGSAGVGRRLECRGTAGGVQVYDDYAHHPREIEATLAAVREQWQGRVTAVFQPHRYSRAEELASDFGRAFYGADKVIVAPIYPAGEVPRAGVDAAMLAAECRRHGHKDVRVADSLEAVAAELEEQLHSEELVITLGAGSVWRVGVDLLQRLTAAGGNETERGSESEAMVARQGAAADLVADLAGTVRLAHPLSRCTSYRLGGPAEVAFEPTSTAAAAETIVRGHDAGVPVTVIGGGTNLLVADEGVPGVVMSLGRAFADVKILSEGRVIAGAAVPLAKLMHSTLRAGLSGLEVVAGIPGSVAGAVVMNAGTHDGEIGDSVVAVRAIDREGCVIEVAGKDLGLVYRGSNIVAAGLTLLEIEFALEAGDVSAAEMRMKKMRDYRNRTQPHAERSAGSVFKNPPGEAAGQLIDACGLKGSSVGGALVSPVHANYLIAKGGCTAADVAALIALCRERVWAEKRIALELEIRPLGFAPGELPRTWSGS